MERLLLGLLTKSDLEYWKSLGRVKYFPFEDDPMGIAVVRAKNVSRLYFRDRVHGFYKSESIAMVLPEEKVVEERIPIQLEEKEVLELRADKRLTFLSFGKDPTLFATLDKKQRYRKGGSGMYYLHQNQK